MKSKFKLLIIFIALFLAGFFASAKLRGAVIATSSTLIANAQSAAVSALEAASTYFNTTEEIKRLRAANKELGRYKILHAALLADYGEILSATASAPAISGAKLLRISSFVQLGQRSKFWADAPAPERPKALVFKDHAAGILSVHEGRAYAISLADTGCAIAAKIGIQQAIVRGDGNAVWADFIEDYAQIAPGAKVYSSGMDGIFPAGVYIGQIGAIEQHAGYKRARISGWERLENHRFVYALE